MTPRLTAAPIACALPYRVDATTVADVRYELDVAWDSGSGDLHLDCSGLEVLDSAGLALLVGLHRRSSRAERRLVLVDPRPNVMRLLAVTRLHRVLHLDRAHRTG
jgi:anti-sigma B factor antagonist